MEITWEHITVDFEPGDVDLLSEWRWLIGETGQPILVTALGDAFLQEPDDSIWWLDVAGGEFTQVAANPEEFDAAMAENADDWFAPKLVHDLLVSGATLKPNECFSYKKPPILGGQFGPKNFEPASLSVHFSIFGQLHRQVKDLPDGTPIGKIEIVDP